MATNGQEQQAALRRLPSVDSLLQEPQTCELLADFGRSLSVEALRAAPTSVVLPPGPRHWSIFTDLCEAVGAKGNLVPDAYLAALAIESGSEWITTDHDFSRFPGLRWRHPLATS